MFLGFSWFITWQTRLDKYSRGKLGYSGDANRKKTTSLSIASLLVGENGDLNEKTAISWNIKVNHMEY